MQPSLNSQQRLAVEQPAGPVLVIAGAGSGKTRVLTARVARLLESGAAPESIVAFTFTNRAAREMRERIERVVGETARRLWVGTFHATGVRLLRRDGERLGIGRNFTIYDREDQENVVRELMKRLESPDGLTPGNILTRISDAKNALVGPDEAARLAVMPRDRWIAECYRAYQLDLRRHGALDFDDLIGETVKLLRDHPEIGARYGRRFHHVLVDEYQDTNHAQFRLVEKLAAVHGSVFAVGDDDQSIYGWRGADIANVLDFEKAFPGAVVVRLEQNYRSTGRILEAANAVIANNRGRKGKNLWCDREAGAFLRFVLAGDEVEEALQVRTFVAEWVRHGGKLGDCAVLYRTNAQSRALETELRHALVPYEIVGGVAFYQRREIKDLLAYLRLLVNPVDAVAFWRIWNTPRRGLGGVAKVRVEERMAATGAPPIEALRSLVVDGSLTRAATSGASGLLALLDDLASGREGPPERVFVQLLERTGYVESLGTEGDAADRRANVEELGVAIARHGAQGGNLEAFLGDAALVTDMDRMADEEERLLLMTAHNAKGLEFPAVIVTGLEEGLFPHGSALADDADMEEERRLFYVALTRAREAVLLTAAAYRRRYDGAYGGAVSRFVAEIPERVLLRQDLRPARAGRADDDGDEVSVGWARRRRGGGADVDGVVSGVGVRAAGTRRHAAVGREVYHDSFGRGVVVAAEGQGSEAKYTVRFGTQMKRVLGRFLSGGDDGD